MVVLKAGTLKVGGGTGNNEPLPTATSHGDKFEFERHRYFAADRVDHVQETKPVFNLAVGLKDSWGK